MTVEVILPNGNRAKATYRSDFGNAAYVRINGVTVSGNIGTTRFMFQAPSFTPKGVNAALVQRAA